MKIFGRNHMNGSTSWRRNDMSSPVSNRLSDSQEIVDSSSTSSNGIDSQREYTKQSILRKTRENESRSFDDKDNSGPFVFTENLISSLTNDTFTVLAEMHLKLSFL